MIFRISILESVQSVQSRSLFLDSQLFASFKKILGAVFQESVLRMHGWMEGYKEGPELICPFWKVGGPKIPQNSGGADFLKEVEICNKGTGVS